MIINEKYVSNDIKREDSLSITPIQNGGKRYSAYVRFVNPFTGYVYASESLRTGQEELASKFFESFENAVLRERSVKRNDQEGITSGTDNSPRKQYYIHQVGKGV